MKISTKKINELRDRLGISFEDAIELLRKSNGDIEKSIKLYYRQKKYSKSKTHSDIHAFFSDVCKYRFAVCRRGKTIINLPLLVLLGFLILAYQPLWHVVLISAIVIIVSGSEVQIFKEKETENLDDELCKKTESKQENKADGGEKSE